ncbi:MAG TPA: PCYCGC motif-containing (lipo)protein [Anaerolineae bacterium]|jgi:hypothetical protein
MWQSKRKYIVLLVPALILFSVTTAGCGAAKQAVPLNDSAPVSATGLASEVPMASMADMPIEVKSAPILVQQAYRYAVANPQVLMRVPCYCGCGKMGHTSNYSCYVKSAEAGKVVYDNHALGCSICIDITQDAMRLFRDGKSANEIHTYVDATYSRYGPSNLSE